MKEKKIATPDSPVPSNPGEAPSGPRPTWARLVVYAGLFLLSLALTGSFLRPDQCQTRGCSPYVPTPPRLGDALLTAGNMRLVPHQNVVDVWIEFGESGVFTPTTTAQGTVITTDDGQTIPFLDDLAQNGYLALRLPHAPPNYTPSQLLTGTTGEPNAVKFNYYSPPTATLETTVVVDVVRRPDLEAIVNSRYPIADNKSHWEVWWLPAGETFPIPDQPFRLEDNWPDPLMLAFRIDFVDADPLDCAGCPIEILAYNGSVSIGPYEMPLRLLNSGDRDPLVSFGAHCVPYVYPTVGQYITPSVPFTQSYCLENWDTVSRTFRIEASSSQGWDYAYFWQGASEGTVPIPAGDPPFTIEVGPGADWDPGCMGILATYTPTIAISDTLRETLFVTATSTISAEVQARALNIALAPGYVLDEKGAGLEYVVHLPLVLR